jgi:DNA-binding GntR family transcriptional regulator
MKLPIYRSIQNALKLQIQTGEYKTGDYLPSENDLCEQYQITRTTARKALEELLKEGFIDRQHGKRSKVIERRKSLGLLSVKGFSEAAGQSVETLFLQLPGFRNWNINFPFKISESELITPCIHFERLRCFDNDPVMLENNWLSAAELPGFVGMEMIDGSFFKTLSQNYQIEIIGSEQELRAIPADEKISELLKIKRGSPLLQIHAHFSTSKKELNIYAELFCNTAKFPVGNSYFK